MTVEFMQVIATAIQVIALFALIAQLYLMKKDRLAHHERTRVQATIEYAGPLWAEARFELETRFGGDVLAKKKAEEIYEDADSTFKCITAF